MTDTPSRYSRPVEPIPVEDLSVGDKVGDEENEEILSITDIQPHSRGASVDITFDNGTTETYDLGQTLRRL